MRLIKILSLATVAIFAAMAFAGASSALASGSTALCNNTSLPCNSVYTGHYEALSTHVIILGVFDVLCTHSKMLGTVLGLANPLVRHITELTMTGCDCLVHVTDQTGLLLGLKIAPNRMRSTTHGFAISVKCGGIECTFSGPGEGIEEEGGAPATMTAEEVEMEKLSGGFFCGSGAFFDGAYTIVLPTPIYISS